jgi:hypothetical protein
MEPGERIAAGGFVSVGVDLQGRADPGVAQDGLSVPSWHLQILEQRADRVAQVMDLDDPDAVAVADAPEGPDQVARLDRPTGAGREHEAGFRPGGAHVSPVGSLTVFLELERVAYEVEQRQISFASSGLDGRQEQFASDALELLADLDRPGVKVDVLPAQAEGFTTAQAIEDEQDERSVQRVGLGSRASSYLARFWGLRRRRCGRGPGPGR